MGTTIALVGIKGNVTLRQTIYTNLFASMVGRRVFRVDGNKAERRTGRHCDADQYDPAQVSDLIQNLGNQRT